MKERPFSPAEIEQLAELEKLPDDMIDTTDIPEAPEENWVHARRGNFDRPLEQPATIRLDADVVAWFKEHADARGYQTEINSVLRRHMSEMEKRRA